VQGQVSPEQIIPQIGYLGCGLGDKRMIPAKTDHKPVAAQFFHLKIGMHA
jgi:hypothetical protein